MSEPFIGEIRMFPYSFPPENWAYCNGQLLQIAQNTVLFAVIGDMYGGDGRVTMGLPNLKGRVPMHPGHGPGLSYHQVSEMGGFPGVLLQEATVPSHTHQAKAYQKPGAASKPATNLMVSVDNDSALNIYETADSNLTDMSKKSLGAAGANQSHENRQPYLATPFCIAISGIFPSRN